MLNNTEKNLLKSGLNSMVNNLNKIIMAKIEKLWFDSERIWITTDEGQTLSRPLEAFPTLKDATEPQRLAFNIGRFGNTIRWEEIDEDIHISRFYDTEEPDYDNEIARIFRRFPQLNVSEVARSMGIHKSLLSKYIYGMKRPSEQRKQQIKESLHLLGQELLAV